MTITTRMLVVLGLLVFAACGSWEPSPLPPPETFNWTDRPIAFSPPPAEWARHRWQQGGMEGVSFQIPRVPPGRILIAEYYLLKRGHRRILDSGKEIRFFPPAPGFNLADVIDRVRFDPMSLPLPDSVQIQPEFMRSVGGLPASGLDYTYHDTRHSYVGREVYFLADEHLFVATLLGKEDDLELFEKVVATVRFPSPPAEAP